MNPLNIRITSVIDALGRSVIDAFLYFVHISRFTASSLASWRMSGKRRGINRRSVFSQIIFSGIDALPAITILSLALALSITSQFILLLESITSQRDVIQVLTQAIAQELAPLLTAIILIGRSGSAITVDLGNMSYNQELRGLELLGIDIKQFFVLPRIIGLLFSQFVLAVYFSFIVLVVGIIFTALLYSPSNYKYLFLLVDSISAYELLIFTVKNLTFGLVIGSVACFHGLRVRDSVTQVPQQTQRAIVNSLVMVFVLDGLLVVFL